jgi:hypothetical protein
MEAQEAYIEEFVNRVLTDWYDSKSFNKFSQVELECSLKEVMSYIKKNKLQHKFIDPPFDFTDRGAYLDKVNPFIYEVFDSERGGKHLLKKFNSLDKAIERKLVLLLNMAASEFKG